MECDGNDVVPQFWAELSSDIEEIERHDFALKAVDNDRHVIVALTVMINVWNWGNDWKIKVTENGKELRCSSALIFPTYSGTRISLTVRTSAR